MRPARWQVLLGIGLIVASAAVYVVHYLLFRDVHHILIYLVGDIAFVGIEVFLVTLVVHQLLSQRERRARLQKLNMVIGAFFSEVGTRLLAYLSDHDPGLEGIRQELIVEGDWTDREFAGATRRLKHYRYDLAIGREELVPLKEFLLKHREFMLRLLENPNLLEHESFTDLLRAVFHFTEELDSRERLDRLPDTDTRHLLVDAKRVYVRLARQWVEYMKYLKGNYPYLFSLAVRTNPFDRDASVIVG